MAHQPGAGTQPGTLLGVLPAARAPAALLRLALRGHLAPLPQRVRRRQRGRRVRRALRAGRRRLRHPVHPLRRAEAVYYGVARPSLNFGQSLLPEDAGTQNLAGLRLRGYFDQLDNLNFPRHGWAASFQLVKGLEALGSDNDYDQWEGSAVVARSWNRHSLNVALRGSGRITDNDRPIYIAQPWGGFLQQSGFLYGRVNYFYRLLDVPLFEGLYAGVAGEVGNYGQPLVAGNPSGTIYSGAAYLAFDSPLGPMYLGVGYGKGGNTAAYFYLGRP